MGWRLGIMDWGLGIMEIFFGKENGWRGVEER